MISWDKEDIMAEDDHSSGSSTWFRKKHRNTVQKDAILNILRSEPDFMSSPTLHSKLQSAGLKVGMATVYRQLGALASEGKVDTIHLNGEQLYRLCDEGHGGQGHQHRHHHHMVCENCGKTVEIEPPNEQWINKAAAEHGFSVTYHMFEIIGLCPECRRKLGAE